MLSFKSECNRQSSNRAIYMAAAFFMMLSTGRAQNLNRNLGTQDTDVPSVQTSATDIGHADLAALGEIRANARVIKSSTWLGMTASGTITYAGSSNSQAATLSMLPGNRSRLEVITTKGTHLTIINGSKGHVKYAGGKDQRILGMTASAGIAPFDLPKAVLEAPESYAVIERGVVAIGGQSLHRITIESLLPPIDILPGSPSREAMDCYFDPETHLLVKTASFVFLPGAGLHQFFRVTTYASYQISNAVSLPGSISETLDGQPTWTLSLTSLDTVNVPKPESF